MQTFVALLAAQQLEQAQAEGRVGLGPVICSKAGLQ